MDRRLTIGTAADNDVRLRDPYVSGHHCFIERTGGRLMLNDLGSRNGTFVAGIRVNTAELRPGVRLVIGQTGMRLVARGGAADEAMIGQGAAMARLRQEIAEVAPTRASVLLLGESGTGKELAAHAIHAASGRSGEFVAINCGAIAAELVESELFGHERGAFTGAIARHAGVIQEADGGTLFLDEVGELPLPLQAKFLRVLETGRLRPVGGMSERRVDVRIIAATHQDLPERVVERNFRLDLYHRLATVELYLAPLRERREDIAELAGRFLHEMVEEVGPKALSQAALAALLEYPWPGNVRELRNAIRRGAILGGQVLEPKDVLPAHKRARFVARPLGEGASDATGAPTNRIVEIERVLIERALVAMQGNRRAAAQALGMPKSTFCDKVKRYNISVTE